MKKLKQGLAAVALITLSAFAQTNSLEEPTAVNYSNSSDGFYSSSKFTDRQVKILTLAYQIAKEDGLDPHLLQGIVLQESSAGGSDSYKVVVQDKSRFYGVSQLTIGAAKDVLRAYPELRKEFKFQTSTNEELMAKLIENDEFNLSVASKYLLILKRFGFDTIRQLALAYNQGPGGAKLKDSRTFPYANGVVKHIHSLPTKTTSR